jgi:hypothetical protein
MKFGVLLHRPMEGVEGLPSWPAWLPWVEPPCSHSPDPLQPPPVQMRVRYVGPVVLGWGQLALLLQYQDVVQRHINPRSKVGGWEGWDMGSAVHKQGGCVLRELLSVHSFAQYALQFWLCASLP